MRVFVYPAATKKRSRNVSTQHRSHESLQSAYPHKHTLGMLSKTKLALAFIPILLLTHSANAEERLDQILEELQSLRQQVANLEARLDAIENKSETANNPQATAPANTKSREGKTWFDNMRVELKKAEVRASGPWTNPAAWKQIQNGLKEKQVLAALGEPTQRKFSVRRDTDEILIYRGDLEGTGVPIEGEIRIYKGKVRRFTAPDFPNEG